MNAFVINQKQIRHLLATLQSDVFENPLYGLQGARALRNGSDPEPPRTVLGSASELALAVLEANIRALEGQLHGGDESGNGRPQVPARISED